VFGRRRKERLDLETTDDDFSFFSDDGLELDHESVWVGESGWISQKPVPLIHWQHGSVGGKVLMRDRLVSWRRFDRVSAVYCWDAVDCWHVDAILLYCRL